MKAQGLTTLLFLSFLCCFQSGGCGKKADPTAPVAVAPAKIKDLVARPRGGAVVLSWSIPEKNTDGTELSDLRGFAILRSEQPFQTGVPGLPEAVLGALRINEHVSYLYEPLHPAVLRIVRSVVQSARNAGIPVAICGEMASNLSMC